MYVCMHIFVYLMCVDVLSSCMSVPGACGGEEGLDLLELDVRQL